MTMLSSAKQLSISLGLYRAARVLHRALHPGARAAFKTHRFLLAEFIRPGDLAFDVGANIGARSEIMLSLGATVIAFEPQPNCAREIRARGSARLTVIEKAVGASLGTAELHLKAGTVQASLLPNWQGGPDVGVLTVPLTTLDVEIEKHGTPAFCKIDVEGFEVEVLRGLSQPISALSLEYHCSEDGIHKVQQCLNRLSEIGNYEINLIGEESDAWLLEKWMPLKNFRTAFPNCASPYFWGDLFAKEKI